MAVTCLLSGSCYSSNHDLGRYSVDAAVGYQVTEPAARPHTVVLTRGRGKGLETTFQKEGTSLRVCSERLPHSKSLRKYLNLQCLDGFTERLAATHSCPPPRLVLARARLLPVPSLPPAGPAHDTVVRLRGEGANLAPTYRPGCITLHATAA